MPAFRNKLNQVQAKELITFIRDFAPSREKKDATSPAPMSNFEIQFDKLQKEFDDLQRQLRELTKEEPRADSRTARATRRGSNEETSDSSTETGAKLYRNHCQRCHGPDGKGVVAKLDVRDPPDFSRRDWHEDRSDARLLASILDGKGSSMPAYREYLTEDAARALVKYIRGLGPPPGTRPARSPAQGKEKRP
jgi:mono/diheme cytochrome c family protein